MTGKELIMYILQNNLENEPVIQDGKFVGFITMAEAAAQLGVGDQTVLAWVLLGRIPCVTVCGRSFIPANFKQNFNMEGSENV